MIQAFNEFRSNFQGDPEQKVKELVASGKISQQQLNWLQSMATQFQKMLNSFK